MIDFAKLRAKKIIANLLNRTVARGCTPAEAEQAVEMTARLCAKYGLSADPEPPPRDAPPWEDARNYNYYKPKREHTRTWNVHGQWRARRATHVEPRHSLNSTIIILKRVASVFGVEGARAILREAGVEHTRDLRSIHLDRVYASCEKRLKQAAGDIFAEAGL